MAEDEIVSIIESMDMSLSKLGEIVKDREAWHTAVQGCFSVKDPICRITQWNCSRLNNGPQDTHVLIPRTYDILYGKGGFTGVIQLRILGWGECPGLSRSAQCFEDGGRRTHTTRWRQSQSYRAQGYNGAKAHSSINSAGKT